MIPVRCAMSAGDLDIDTAVVADDQGRRWVVSAGADAASGARLEQETVVLQALSGTELAPLVQSPLGFASLPEGGRAPIALALEGERVDPDMLNGNEQLIVSLGQTVAAVHNTPQWAIESAGVEEFTVAAIIERNRATIRRVREQRELPGAVLQRWLHLLDDTDLWNLTPRFIHGSLSEDTVLAVGNSVSGLLDFSQARVADPAADVAWVLSCLEPEAFDTFFTAYTANLDVRPDARLVERAQLTGEFAVLEWVLSGLDTDDDSVVEDGMAMLQDVETDLAEMARHDAEEQYDSLSSRD